MYTNPADHRLDVIPPPRITANEPISPEKQENVDRNILAVQHPVEIDLNMDSHKRIGQMSNLPPGPIWIKQFFILLRRNFQEQIRSSKIMIAVLIGCIFLQIGNGQSRIVRRSPVIFFCAINQDIFGALMVINSFSMERASGTYYVTTYFTEKILTDTLVQAPVPIVLVMCRLFS